MRMHRRLMQRNFGAMMPYYSPSTRRGIPLWMLNLQKAGILVSCGLFKCRKGLTAKDPGAFLAAVHPHPLYRPKPSSRTILTTPRPRNASGFVCLLILRTSRGRRMISPIPIMLQSIYQPLCPLSIRGAADLPANECIIAFPVFGPKALSNSVPWFLAR